MKNFINIFFRDVKNHIEEVLQKYSLVTRERSSRVTYHRGGETAQGLVEAIIYTTMI